MLNSAYAYFALYGDFDPADLIERISIRPTSASLKGNRNPERVIPRRAQWKYSTDEKTAAVIDIYEIVDSVIVDLDPYRQEIVNAIEALNLTAVLQVVIRFSTDEEISTPAIGLSRQAVSFSNAVGATIDIDTYIESDGSMVK